MMLTDVNTPAFFDTNIVIYADDELDERKQQIAIQLFSDHLRHGTAVLSLQVLQEYFVVAKKKLRMTSEQAQRKVEIISRARVVRLEAWAIVSAIELHRFHQVSFWDALIIQAASVGGEPVVYSEDLQSGGVIGGVRVVNPFLWV